VGRVVWDNDPRAWDTHVVIDWVFTDLALTHRTELTNGVLIHDDPAPIDVDLTVTLTKPQLLGLLGGAVTLDALTTEGDTGAVGRLLAVLDGMSRDFAIVTP
jgi:alkyl sulfatase BDS1-like metallo-beta-lactamase superfamily hydrolase